MHLGSNNPSPNGQNFYQPNSIGRIEPILPAIDNINIRPTDPYPNAPGHTFPVSEHPKPHEVRQSRINLENTGPNMNYPTAPDGDYARMP